MPTPAPNRTLRRSGWLLASILVTTVGCTASARPSAASSAALTPSHSSPSAPGAAPARTQGPAPSMARSPSAPAAVNEAPSGPWTSLAWIDAGAVLPRSASGPSRATLSVYGWTGGYVAFGSSGGYDGDTTTTPALTALSSADGLHWTGPSGVDIGAAVDRIAIERVAEGPEGLVAVGYFPADSCGGPPGIAGLWHSTDGRIWKPVGLPGDMKRGHVERVDGGSAGYIATGKLANSTTPGVWLSPDGTAWHAAALPKPPSGALVVNDGTSFAGGLVLAGAVVGPEGCGGLSSIHPAVWWSSDGAAWGRQTLPGGMISRDAGLAVRRLSDRQLLAFDQSADPPKAWISTDGRTWTPLAAPTGEALYGTISDGRRSIAVAGPTDEGSLTFKSVGDRLDVRALAQTGSGPIETADTVPTVSAVGPTGIVVVSVDGSHLWLGVPSGS